MKAMDIEEIRKNKRILEKEVGKQILMFCRNHNLTLNDIDLQVSMIQSKDSNHREVQDVNIKLKLEL